MDRIKIIHISDIHYSKMSPENEGLIINSFFGDLEIKENEFDYYNTYCIISGDLVNAGANDNVYTDFYKNFIQRLIKFLPIKNIYCVPGNHDLNRLYFKKNLRSHLDIINQKLSESDFNNYVKSDQSILREKFKPYDNFCTNTLRIENFNYYGYSRKLTTEITIFCLNSALCSVGGYDGIEDEGNLKIETSELNKWISENNGRKKILVMHHPISHLEIDSQKEIESMMNNGIDILINGHIHDQKMVYNNENHYQCCSPQLFSNKKDLLGYSILTFEKNNLINIEYRQWVLRHRKFMSGREFTGSEDGFYFFELPSKELEKDYILKKLQSDFNKSMKSYSQTPEWINRILNTTAPNISNKENNEKLDYLDIINKPQNYQIIAAPQFGVTCFAKYLALKAWEIKKEKWLYFDCDGWSLSIAISQIEDSLSDFEATPENVNCILLDNWNNNSKDSHKIFTKLTSTFKDLPFIIFSNYNDSIILEGLDSEESHEGFKQLYLKELDKSGLRSMVKHFNQKHEIAEEDIVLERLHIDLIDLNIHRTPINCIQILIAFLNNFENRPINRSYVFSYLLKVIFDNPGNLFYGNNLDVKNCIFILGYFCEYLIRNSKELFTEDEFFKSTIPFVDENYNTTNLHDLLEVLKHNQIVVNFNGLLRFRFTYWIYYFAAQRMRMSKEFLEYMFKQKHSMYYPDIIEFYTGTDGAREDAVKMIIDDLQKLSVRVHSRIGLNEEFNPFNTIKWALNETTEGMTQEQLETQVRNSQLPTEIKDVISDKEYNSVKPYTQTIVDFFEEYDVRNLMDLTRSASRALRNSEFIKPQLKEELAHTIFQSWQEILRVLFLISPLMAKNGFGGIGGARFSLSDDFPKEYNECLKTIITVLPFNIVNWYKDDILSDKLIKLLNKYLVEFPDPNIRHLIALTICNGRPEKWNESVLKYIGEIGRNSYYLGDLYSTLRYNYSYQYMDSKKLKQSEYLIKACWSKNKTGSPKPGRNRISKVPDSALPQRDHDLE